MAKPVLMAVDDDREVLRAVERDLRHEYGERFRVLAADSARSALEALQGLKLRNQTVALLLVDQRMPYMTGVEFLEQAADLFPDAKRVLLTAYADTDVAIRAINQIRLDHYLLKPWDPPEEHLYPVLQDLLGDWLASFRPPFEGVRVVGHRWSPRTHQVKDFLARNLIPYRALDVETDPEAARLVELAGAQPAQLPVVFFPGGSYLLQPDNLQIAERVGLQTRTETRFCDLIIVGGGPAGLAAAVYGASEGLHTVLVEREAPGGQAGTSARIENYLGFPVGLTGADLARRAVAQARRFGVEILTPREAVNLRSRESYRIVTLADGTELSARAVVIATGVSYRRLGIPGTEQLTEAGVYYGATMTEALAFRGQDVFMIGGGNSAGQAALYFAKHCQRAVMLVRGGSLERSMSQYLVDQIRATPNIEVWLDTRVIEAHGGSRLESVTVENLRSGEIRTVPANALFAFIGAVPHTDWVADTLARDAQGYILTGSDLVRGRPRPLAWPLDRDPYLLETCVPGIFAAGDVRHGAIKRVAAAVGEGAIAVRFVHEYLSE